MKRILFTLIAIFATVNLAHGQTLSYNSPDSVLIAKSEYFTPDTSRVLVRVHIIEGFKADKDGNGFDCNDPYVLRGDKDVWHSIWDAGKISFFDSGTACVNNEYQWSFDVTSNDDPESDIIFDVDVEGVNYTIVLLVYTMDGQETLAQKRIELEDNGTLLSSGSLSINSRNQGFDIQDDKDSSTSSEAPQELPNAISLEQNYPNPFNPRTTITYQIDTPQHVRLDVFNAQGQRIQTLVDGMRATGDHHISFDAAGLSSGVYVYRIHTETEAHTRKMLLVR